MEQEEAGLKRSLGLIDATAIGLGAIIGAGVFVAIAPAVGVAGSLALVSMIVAGLVALFNSLSSAQLAAAYPESGGTYVYGRELVSDWLGFTAGWVFVVAAISADSAIALTFAAYLGNIVPEVPARMIAVGIGAVVVCLNYLGIRHSAAVNTYLVAAKVAILLFFVIYGAFFFDASRLAPLVEEGPREILGAAALLFFAYTGYARIATLGEEVRDPERTIPKAILTALGISTVLYVAALLVALGLVGREGIADSDAPLSAAMGVTGSGAAVYIISLGALIATFTVFLTDQLGISRMVFAMARNSDLPLWLSAVHARRHTPHRAVLVTGAAVLTFTAVLPLRGLVEAGSFGLLIYYGITNYSALRLPDRMRRYHRGWAAAGLFSCAVLALFLPWRTIALELAVVGLGVVWFFLNRRLKG